MPEGSKKIRFSGFMRSNKRVLLLVTILMALYAAFECAMPYSMHFIIDDGLQEKNLRVLTLVFIVLGVSGVTILFAQVLRDYLYLDLCSRFLERVREETFSHLQSLSMCFYSRTPPGEILSRFSTDVAAVEYCLTSAPAQLIIPVISATITVVLLFILSAPLAGISMLIFPAFFLGPYFLTPKASQAGHARKDAEAATISDVQTNISSQSVIKAFNLQKVAAEFFQRGNTRLRDDMRKALFTGSLVERSSITAALLLQALLLGVGAYLTYYGHLEVGELVAFEGLFLGLTYNILYCSNFVPLVIQARVGLNRVHALMDEVPKVVDIDRAMDLPPFHGEIRFESVSFGYTPDKTDLHDLDFSIPRGSSVAFVGGSGCGKSTVLSLLMRFYDIDRGTITIDGQDIKRVTQNSLRHQFGIVLQDNVLFNLSMLANIRAGKPGAPDEEVHEAARKAEIHDFILSLPDGYETLAGERGGQLSGGQRQRIAIARALLHGGNILVLDEATSALDPVTQASVNRTIANIGRSGMTIISVTHTLSTVVGMDTIFVMEQGRIVGRGSHEALLARDGVYRRMWDEQA